MAFKRGETLEAADFDGFVVDVIAVVFQLSTGMDGFTGIDLCILMKDADKWAVIGFHVSTGRNDVKVGELMIIQSTDVGLAIRCVDDGHVRTGKTSIGTTIDQGSVVEEGPRISHRVGDMRIGLASIGAS